MKQNGIGVDDSGNVTENEFISNLYSNAKYVSEHINDSGMEIDYKIVVYDVSGNYVSSSAVRKQINSDTTDTNIFISNHADWFKSNGIQQHGASGFTSDGNVDLRRNSNSSFNPDCINKILVVIDSVTPSGNVSINSFKWIEGGDNPQTVNTVMQSVGTDVTIIDEGEATDVDPSDLVIIDPALATFDMQDILDYIKAHNIPLAKLFKDPDFTPENELYLYKSDDYPTDIKWTGYSATCDNQYKSFITRSDIYNIDFPSD